MFTLVDDVAEQYNKNNDGDFNINEKAGNFSNGFYNNDNE